MERKFVDAEGARSESYRWKLLLSSPSLSPLPLSLLSLSLVAWLSRHN